MKSISNFKTQLLLLLILSITIFLSCTPAKTQYFTDLQAFVVKVEKEYPNYTDKDWENTKLAWEKLSKERYEKLEPNLTSEEKTSINVLFDRYEACRDKAVIKDLKNGIKSGIERASNFIKNIVNDSSLSK